MHSAPTALFPLPLPYDGLFAKRSRRRTQRRRLPHLCKVVVHVLVMALNFLYTCGRFVPAEALRRVPSEAQSGVFDRLMGFVRASARLGGQTLQQGRKGLQLAARQAEVLDFLRAAGVQEGCYSGAAVPEPCFVEHLGGGPEELNPYRSLDSNRVVLSGRGSWDIARHLEPALLLPFLEPLTLRTFEPQPSPGPTFQREDRRQVLGLLKKWDDLGLLSLVEGPRDDSELTRILRDRQIGDRRNVNNKEARIADGPSRRLPAGSVLCKLSCPRWTHALFGTCVDRKDFYHQALVSAPRAASNAIGPVFELRAFLGCQAHAAYLAHADHSFCAQCPSGVFKPSSVLVDAEVKVHGAFRSLLQGDHAGVEFAASGHEGLLRSFGVLGDRTGLIIDDLFSISCELWRTLMLP